MVKKLRRKYWGNSIFNSWLQIGLSRFWPAPAVAVFDDDDLLILYMFYRCFLNIFLNEKLSVLINFAVKSRALASGFEAVKRSLLKGNAALVLLDDTLTEHSRQKINSLANKTGIPVYFIKVNQQQENLVTLTGYKILALHRGALAKGFKEKL